MFLAMVAATALASGPCDDFKIAKADVEKHLVLDLLPDAKKRLELEAALRSGSGLRCGGILREFVGTLQKGTPRSDFLPVRNLLLEVSANGNIENAQFFLESEISAGRGEDYLDILKNSNVERYTNALRKWTYETSKGMSKKTEQVGMPTRVLSPLYLERFLRLFANGGKILNGADCSALNTIFIGAPSGDRELFLPLLGKAIRNSATVWLKSFRSESTTSQFRLFPIFEAAGGPDVVAELMSISQDHADARMRALAERSLNKILSEKKKN